MSELLGLCLAVWTLLALATLASFCSSFFWRIFGHLFDLLSAATRANLVFALRFLPVGIAFALVGLFLIPSYILDEPRDSGEVVTFKFAIASLIAITGIVIATWRGVQSWKMTKGLQNGWMQDAKPIKIDSVSIP